MRIKNFNENFDKIIVLVSIIFATICAAILLFININIFYSFILCSFTSLVVFIKNSIIISNVLYHRLEPAKRWIIFNNITSSIIYIAAIIIVVLLEPFNIIGLTGLLIVSIVTTILGIIHK